MAKRFRDTRLSREAWYRKLAPKFKCAWDFICDECDQAGMWAIDMDAMSFYVGEEIELSEFMSLINADKMRIEPFGNDKIWIVGFVEFQNGSLSEKSPAHKPIFTLLKKYRLLDRVLNRVSSRVSDTLQVKVTVKEEGIVKEEEKVIGDEIKFFAIEECVNISLSDDRWARANKTNQNELEKFNQYLERLGRYSMNPIDYKTYFAKLKGKYPDMIKQELSIEQLRKMATELDKEKRV